MPIPDRIILVDLARTTVRQMLTAPLAGALQSAFAGGGLFGLFHEGGIAGERPPAVRYADAALFEHAPRYHGGGFAGAGLPPDEVPIIARRGDDPGLPGPGRTRERQAELVARGAGRTMNSRHLTGQSVDLLSLDGEVSWQWEDYFRVAAAMQAAAHEIEVPVCWGGC
jgi:peptidoglycan L-alanyl-D-glutamate endopeptidase CwlK